MKKTQEDYQKQKQAAIVIQEGYRKCQFPNTVQSDSANPTISANTKPQAMVASLIASNMQYIPNSLMALLQETKVSKPDVIKTVLPDPDMASNTNNVVNPTPDKQICIAKLMVPDIQQAKAKILVEVINSSSRSSPLSRTDSILL